MNQPSAVVPRLFSTPRTNYIFIDYENVYERDLSRIEGRSAVVHLVLGARQPDPPEQLHKQIHQLAEKAELIRTPIAGITKNALDFVLACEVGMRAAKDPAGYFHIISKDKGFDVVIKHLRKKKILAARRDALSEVPALMSTEERFDRLSLHLANPAKTRPDTRSSLASMIQKLFDHGLTEEVVGKTIRLLINQKILTVSKTEDVTYPSLT
ncbi:MAG: PIN domain-containing protein [Verrucomicrobiota bacterium]